jgi:molybdopterin-guanine dinucleotide biosynthesis protein A
MGRDKAWLPWLGKPLVCQVVEKVSESVDETIVVASPEQELPPLDARIVRDRAPHLGPLAGLREGLESISNTLAFVTATDAPFLTSRFIEDLLSRNEPLAPEVDGFVQTLCAVYPSEAGAVASRLLDEERQRPLELLREMNFTKVPANELVDPQSIQGFNTPEAYLDAARSAEPGAQAQVLWKNRNAVAVPIGTLEEVLRAAGLDPDRTQVRLDNSLTFDKLSIPIGSNERIWVTPSEH